jgi:hypothetical protein
MPPHRPVPDRKKVAMAVRPKGSFFRIVWYWLPVVLMMAFIFRTSSIPGTNIPELFSHQDILYHGAVYVILAWFFMRALKHTRDRMTVAQLVVYTVIFCSLYGASDEIHQLFTPARNCDLFDLLTDTTGSFIGALAGGMYFRWRS